MKTNQLAIYIFILIYFSACKPDYKGQNVGIWREKVFNNTADSIQVYFSTLQWTTQTTAILIPDSVKIASKKEVTLSKGNIYYDESGLVYEAYNAPYAPNWKFIYSVKKGSKSYKKEALKKAVYLLVVKDKMPTQVHDYVWIFGEENFE